MSNIPIIKPVVVKTVFGFEYLDFDEIIWMKAEGNYTSIYTTKNTKAILALDNLSSIEKNLNTSFCKCHRSYIVNTKYLSSLNISSKTIAFDGGIKIPVSKNWYTTLKLMSKKK